MAEVVKENGSLDENVSGLSLENPPEDIKDTNCNDNGLSSESSEGAASTPGDNNSEDNEPLSAGHGDGGDDPDAGGIGFNILGRSAGTSREISSSSVLGHGGSRSTNNISSSKFGVVKNLSNEYYYPMTKAPRGHCLIFNHKHFDAHVNMGTRNGTDKDRDEIKKLFEKHQFNVTVFNDLTEKQIMDQLEMFAEEVDHTMFDCLVVFFLSHGDDGILYSRNSNFKQEDLFNKFEGDRCPSLAGKPKLFFIQACRGGKLDPGVPVYIETDSPTTTMMLPVTSDFLIMWSTVPGYYSWRNTTNGAWFIQSLLHILKNYIDRLDVASMHTVVNRHMINNFQSNTPGNPVMHQMKQCSTLFSTCTRLIHFYPNSKSK